MPTTLLAQVSKMKCQVENSHQISPMLEVMEYYSKKVNPVCPSGCVCYFHHFASSTVPGDKEDEISARDRECKNLHKHCSGVDYLVEKQAPISTLPNDSQPSFTVLVNCSSQDLTTFPTLPPKTTVLDLSHNLISSFYSLYPIKQNYQHISTLILSHNRLSTLDTKLLKLKLDQSFKADHNDITEIPYDLSLLLQKYAKNEVFLGNNPWACSCNAEITNLVRQLATIKT